MRRVASFESCAFIGIAPLNTAIAKSFLMSHQKADRFGIAPHLSAVFPVNNSYLLP
jgi:hypothetical protein